MFAVDPAQQRRARSVGRHRQDVGAGGALREPAQGGRRSREHPGDHVHAQGRRRDARAHRPRAAAAADRSELDRRRWLELRDRLGEIAISTIDAFCLSLLREFPLEADLDPGVRAGRRDRGAAARRPRRSIGRCGSSSPRPQRRRRRAGARAARDLAHARGPGHAARPPAGRLGRARSLPGARSARPDVGGSAAARDRRAAATCSRPCPAGSTRFSPTGRPAIRATRCSCATRAGSRRLRRRRSGGRSRAVLDARQRPLPDQRGQGAEGGTIYPLRGRLLDARRDEAPPRRGDADRAAGRGGDVRLQPRPQRRARARRAADVRASPRPVSPRARRALGPRFLRRAAAGGRAAAADGRVLAEPLPARVALSPRAGRRVPGHEPRAVGAGVAAGPGVGRGAGRRDEPRRSSSSAIASSRSTGSATPRSACSRRPPFIDGLRPGGGPGGRSRAASARCPSCCVRQRSVRRDVAAARSATSSPTTSAIVSRRRASRPPDGGAAAGARHRRRRTRGMRGRRGRRDRARSCATGTVRDKRPACARARPGDIAILFRSRAEPSRVRARARTSRGIPTYVYKGLGFFDADEIKDVVALIRYLADPVVDLRAAAFLRSRLRPAVRRGAGARWRRLAAAWPRPCSSGPPAAVPLLTTRIGGCSSTPASPRVAGARRIGCRRPSSSIGSSTRPATRSSCAAAAAQAWENLKKMRGLVRRIQNRGYATLPRIAEHLDVADRRATSRTP